MQEEFYIDTSDTLKVIAHPMRLKILCLLLEGERNVSELHGHFGTSFANVSQHLQKLQQQKLVTTEKRANFVYSTISDARLESLIKVLYKLYCPNS